jgi:hypothetical protein
MPSTAPLRGRRCWIVRHCNRRLFDLLPGTPASARLTLASGVGIGGLQARVDAMEQKATDGERFTEVGKALRNLFSPGLNGTRRSNGH